MDILHYRKYPNIDLNPKEKEIFEHFRHCLRHVERSNQCPADKIIIAFTFLLYVERKTTY